MRNTFDLGILVPLEKASDHRRCGVTAVVFCGLIRRGVQVPLGFCLSADAYRSHLWSSGARNTAARCENSAQREAVRNALLSSDIPSDVLDALKKIYDQVGCARVVVMPSPCGNNTACMDLTGRFEAETFGDMLQRVKEVWASIWSEELAVTTDGSGREPAVAVVVQAAVDGDLLGTAITANPLNGNPNEIEIRLDNTSADAVGLWTLSVYPLKVLHEAVGKNIQVLSEETLLAIARAAIAAEEVIGRTAEIRWAVRDGEVFLLSTTCAKGIKHFFPYDMPSLGVESGFWRLLSPEPVSMLARSLIVLSGRRISAVLPKALEIVGGRVYRLVYPGDPKRWGVRAIFGRAMKSRRAAGRWKSAKDRITRLSRQILRMDPTNEPDNRIWSVFADAFECASESLAWFEAIPKAAYDSVGALREQIAGLGGDTGFVNRLLRSACVESRRDIGFHRLAAYVWQAEQLADSKGLAKQVQDTALEFGYSFRRSLDARDPACWESWIEDPKVVLKIARALARGQISDRVSAAREALYAQQEAERLLCSGLGMLSRRRLRKALERARFWTEAAWARSEVHALAMTALRIAAISVGARLVEKGVLENRDDVFLLTFEELRSVMSGYSADFLNDRKLDLMRERRLSAPKWIPSAPDQRFAVASAADEAIVGTPGGFGAAEGRVRIVSNLEEAVALKHGEILVCEDVCPAWTPLLSLASGVLMAKGDIISPGAAVARDLGIPCVYQAGEALSIPNGAYIRINGDTGAVEIIGRRKPRARV